MKQLVHILNISKKPIFQATTSLMTEIITVARTQYKPDLLPMKSVCPLPDLSQSYNLSFAETSLNRASEIWQKYAVDDTINLLWSGGIDSSVTLLSILQTAPKTGLIKVYCNVFSISENPNLYRILLNNKNIVFEGSTTMPEDLKLNFITGELGDQIFGSDLLFGIANTIGFSALHLSFDEVIPEFFHKRCGAELGEYLYNKYRPIVEEAPFKLKTAFDFIWWWNFTQKWQCVKFRKDSVMSPNFQCIHFYEAESFQLWSVNNHEKKIKNNLQSYKMPAKEFIYEFDKNAEYLKHKQKYGSLFGNKFFYFALYDDGSKVYTWKECDQIINELSPQY